MVRSNVISRKNKMKLKQSFILFMVFLVTFGGMIPSTTPVFADAFEQSALEEPEVSKDVDGEDRKELTKGEDFNYNVKVLLPEDVSGYETMTILDDLDKRLAIQSTQILIDEEVDDTLKADVKDQKIELSLTQEKLETLAGKEVQLQITTQVNEDTTIEGEIENVAEIVINEDMDLKTDPAIVTLIESVESEEMDEKGANKKEDTEKSEEVVVEETDESETPMSDNAESRQSEGVVAEDSEISVADEEKEKSEAIQPMNTGEFEINHTDSYGNSWETPSVIYQFDGNNPSATPKSSITVRGVAANKLLNGLALSKQNNHFYIASGIELFRIDPSGASLKVTDLLGPTGNGAMSMDGTEYYYSYGQGGKVYFGSFDLISREHNSIEVKGLGSGVKSLGGDLLVDADGLIWFTQGNRLIQFDPTDGNVILNTEMPTDDPDASGRGLSFLPDGRMLLAGGAGNDSNPMLYIYDPELHEINYLGTMPGAVIVDLASAITPQFNPPVPGELKIIKEDADDGTRLAGAKFEAISDEENLRVELVTDENGEAIQQDLLAGKYTIVEIEAPAGYELLTDIIEVTVENDKPTVVTIKNAKIEVPIDPEPESKKFAHNLDADKDKFEVGDTIVYTIQARNIVSDSLIGNLTITDELPEGLAYVEGSIEVSHNGEGEFTDGVIMATFGDVEDTEWRMVTFEATIESGQSGETIENVATVEGDEIPPTNPGTTIIVDPKDPKKESNKSSTLETKAEGNTDADNAEVGDTIRYTIQTKNTIENSLIENLVITDTIPEGLTYVAGSLEVDGGTVTDAEDDDAGHVVDGEVTGNFGDITDTEDHAVTFLVTVDEGQAGKDIKNIAVVDSDNDDPDEPEEEVKIYPREPVLESEKSAQNLDADKDKYEVGDTIVYTIQARNIVSDSLIGNLTIADELPEGLAYVEGSIEVSHNGEGEFTDGVIMATFGDVEDTEWRSVTFEVTIESGQSGETIENVATVEGVDVPPINPGTEIIVDPKDPQLESNKSSSLETKADGNTDADNPEVGDTIRYTIQTKNTIEDSLIENLVITDSIPEGLTYVPNSLEVDGESVTDASDDDAGHVVDGEVTGNFGDITDTKDHTVTFLVTVDEGQAGKDIKNIAVVDSDNHDPDEPEEITIVYPRAPVLESEKLAENLEADKDAFEVGDTIVYTIQTRNTVTDSLVENLVITDELPEGLAFVEGSLSVSHDGEATFTDGVVTATFEVVEDTEWRSVTFEAKIESGQSGQTIENVATVESDDFPPTNPGTEIIVDPKDPQLESNKSSTLETKADGNTDADNPEVGDTIRYTIQTKNTIEDSLIENLVITDSIPEGLTYVAGSLEVDGESVTDASDDDAGHVVDGEVTGNFGDITDTKDHTVTFLVTVDEGQAGKDIKNIAVVDSDNHDPDKPEEEVKIYPRAPKLESEKTAVNLDKDKNKYEVGDTVVYTIKARNTVSDSIIKNLMITDKLPAGLEYVDGSLEVSHEGTGEFKEGTITATFGDVEDTEWYTITFQAKISLDQPGATIKNVATVGADNVTEPNHPEAKVVVEKKDSVTPAPEKTEPPADVEKEEGQKLPKTATNMFNLIIVGFGLMIAGLVFLYFRRNRTV